MKVIIPIFEEDDLVKRWTARAMELANKFYATDTLTEAEEAEVDDLTRKLDIPNRE